MENIFAIYFYFFGQNDLYLASLGMKDQTKAHLALLGANLLYGGGFTVAKSVMPSLIGPQAFILIRVACTSLLFWLSYLIGRDYRAKINRKDFPRLILCAATGVAINQLLFFLGLSKTTPIHASLMMLCTPILVLVMAALLLKEKISYRKVLGIVLGIAGAATLIGTRTTEATATDIVLGDILIFLNAASYAVYLVLVKPLMKAYRPIIVIRWVFLLGLIMVLPFGYNDIMAIQWASFTWKNWAAVAYIIIGITFFTYLWNIYALRILSPSIAGAYIYLQPVFAGLISTLFLGESLTLVKMISAICIFVGVSLVNHTSKKDETISLSK